VRYQRVTIPRQLNVYRIHRHRANTDYIVRITPRNDTTDDARVILIVGHVARVIPMNVAIRDNRTER
jgi:hypothetical protein